MVSANRDVVLVTGAAGFVGSAVVRQALAAGYRVRAAVRDRSRADNLAGLDSELTELAEADIREPLEAERLVAGTRFVIHVAADYRLWAREPGEIVRNNIASTRSIMEAALGAGSERVVYTSSVATLQLRADGQPADERTPLSRDAAIGAYKQSKVAAERLVEDLVTARGLPAVIVNPSTPVGPRDARPTPTGRIIVDAVRGRIPAFVDTGLNLVHVDDVAAGHIAALQRGRIGERYILGGQNATLAVLLADIARLVGRRPPRLRLPRSMLFPAAYAVEALARRNGREPLLTVDGLRLAKWRMYFTSSKAERELGYRPRLYEAGLRDAIAWFRSRGLIG
jgi:dihydroflavonol-4-reductase